MLKLRNQYSNTPLLYYLYLNRNAHTDTELENGAQSWRPHFADRL